MKNNLKLYVGITIGFIMGITCLVYANTYNSSEISYDNRASGSTKTNVKDVVDDLYSHIGDCPEGMNCLTDDEYNSLRWVKVDGKWVTTIKSKGYTEPGTSGGYDACNSAGENCACWYIKKGESNFTYGSHTDCNFISTTCKYASAVLATSFDCANLGYYGYPYPGTVGWYNTTNSYLAACSGVITCAT